MDLHVIRISRSDSADTVLINVSKGKRNDLDLEIEGTEGSVPYFSSFKHHRIAKAVSAQSNLSAEEWETTVRHLLLQQRFANDQEASALANIELSAHITSNQLVLAFRKNISGIHQRIAELVIPKDENRELDTIAWVSTATQHVASLEAEVQQLKAKERERDLVIEQLEQKLEELVQAKIDHEQDMLEKFSRLLNAKKLKIRNQQRLLAEVGGGGVIGDQVKGSKAKASNDPASSRDSSSPPADKPVLPRVSKRKAGSKRRAPSAKHAATAEEAETLDETEDANMTEDGQSTPDRSDEEDRATEDEVDETAPSFKSKDVNKKAEANVDVDIDAAPPPRRNLPFGASKPSKPSKPAELAKPTQSASKSKSKPSISAGQEDAIEADTDDDDDDEL